MIKIKIDIKSEIDERGKQILPKDFSMSTKNTNFAELSAAIYFLEKAKSKLIEIRLKNEFEVRKYGK